MIKYILNVVQPPPLSTSKYFYNSQRKPVSIQQLLSISPSPQILSATHLCFVSVYCLFWRHTVPFVACGSPTLYYVSVLHSDYGWIILHCMDILKLLCASIDGRLGYFHLWAVVDSAAVNMHVHVCLNTGPNNLGVYLGMS